MSPIKCRISSHSLTNEPGGLILELGVEPMEGLGGVRVTMAWEAVLDVRPAGSSVRGRDQTPTGSHNDLDIRSILGLDSRLQGRHERHQLMRTTSQNGSKHGGCKDRGAF